MRKILLFLFICVIASEAKQSLAQTNVYHPFPDSNAVWSIVGCGDIPPYPCGTYWYGIKGDTIVNSISYHKIGYSDSIGSGISLIGGIREDTTTKKIYFSYFSSAEQLLYDFNAGIGDTIFYSINGFCKWTVTSIDSVLLLDGKYRKKFNLGGMGCSTMQIYGPFVIEGVGSSDELLWGCNCTGASANDLLCFKQNGALLYTDSLFNKCYINTISVQELNFNSTAISISPNPSTGIFTLTSSEKFQYIVYDIFGREVYKSDQPINQSATLDLSSQPKGIYFVKIISGDKIITRKIILQ